MPEYLVEKDGKYPIHSNPLVGGLWTLPPRPPRRRGRAFRPAVPVNAWAIRGPYSENLTPKRSVRKGWTAPEWQSRQSTAAFLRRGSRNCLAMRSRTKTPFTLDKLSSWKPRDLVTNR